MPEEILEGRWDCTTCGKVNLGRHTTCQNCTLQKADDAVDYLPDEAQVVTDPELLAKANAGIHWTCENCDKQNAGSGDHCTFCLAPRAAAEDKARTGKRRAEVERQQSEAYELPWDRERRLKQEETQRRGRRVAMLSGVGAAFVVAAAVWCFSPRHVTANVQALHWERVVEVKATQLVQKSDWIEYVPDGAQDRQCDMRLKSAGGRKAQSHGAQGKGGSVSSGGARSMGNGFFSRPAAPPSRPSYTPPPSRPSGGSYSSTPRPSAPSGGGSHYSDSHDTTVIVTTPRQPVYDSWCTYKVPHSVTVRTLRNHGDDSYAAPAWPPDDAVALQFGEWKEQHETYEVKFVDPASPGDTWTYAPKSADEFNGFKVGASHRLKVSTFGAVTVEK